MRAKRDESTLVPAPGTSQDNGRDTRVDKSLCSQSYVCHEIRDEGKGQFYLASGNGRPFRKDWLLNRSPRPSEVFNSGVRWGRVLQSEGTARAKALRHET